MIRFQTDHMAEYAYLRDGEKARGICHACKSPEKSLSVMRKGTSLVWNCFRATCPERGSTHAGVPPEPRRVRPLERAYDTRALPQPVIDQLQKQFGLTLEEISENMLRWRPHDSRVVFPCLDSRGTEVGQVARSYEGALPKSLVAWDPEARCRLYVPAANGRMPARETCVLVEDPVSAIKVARHVPAASLLGTFMRPGDAAWLSRKYRYLVIALDPGAERPAYNLEQLVRPLFRSVKVMFGLKMDPKDMDNDTLRATFGGMKDETA